MLGAIIGDLIGSVYEYNEYQDLVNETVNIERRKSMLQKSTGELLNSECFFSDDTVLTIAIADAIIHEECYAQKLKEYGKKYLHINEGKSNYFPRSFSENFQKWLNSNGQGESDGNGAAMRVSPVGFLFNDLEMVQYEAIKSARPSHNSASALTGAMALASAIYLARNNCDKYEIKEYTQNVFRLNLALNLETLQYTNLFNPTCDVTVAQAIFVFLQSNDFEDAIKKSLSIGGDTDTIASMVGALSEAYYGIPKNYLKRVEKFDIPKEFWDVLDLAYEKCC